MKKYFEILRQCPLFNNMNDEDMTAMLACLGAKVKSFPKGADILAEGTEVREVGVLLTGAARIVRIDYFGNRSIIARLEPGELFGEVLAFTGETESPVTVTAEEASEVLFITASRISSPCANVCDFHNKMIYNLLSIVSRKNLAFNQKIEVTSKRTTRDKLMSYLMLQAKRSKKSEFTIPFDRQELADYLEVERSGLSSEIGKLKREGVIDCNRNTFRIL